MRDVWYTGASGEKNVVSSFRREIKRSSAADVMWRVKFTSVYMDGGVPVCTDLYINGR